MKPINSSPRNSLKNGTEACSLKMGSMFRYNDWCLVLKRTLKNPDCSLWWKFYGTVLFSPQTLGYQVLEYFK